MNKERAKALHAMGCQGFSPECTIISPGTLPNSSAATIGPTLTPGPNSGTTVAAAIQPRSRSDGSTTVAPGGLFGNLVEGTKHENGAVTVVNFTEPKDVPELSHNNANVTELHNQPVQAGTRPMDSGLNNESPKKVAGASFNADIVAEIPKSDNAAANIENNEIAEIPSHIEGAKKVDRREQRYWV